MIGKCDRCGANIGEAWENNFTNIVMESSGCSVTWDKLVENGQILTSMGHPAFPKIEAQHVLMKIGPKEPYTFCWECHRDFLRMVGDFIKLPEYVRNAELLARASPRSKKE